MYRRVVFAGLLMIGLSACASPAKVENMVLHSPAAASPADPALANGICVTSVKGGEETNPLWTSEVNDANFRAALEKSLRNSGLLAADAANCRYGLEANLLGLAQPTIGFDFEVTAHVNYRLLARGSDQPYLLETITSSHTATMGDAFVGVERLRLANEGAIRKNIEKILTSIMSHRPA
jgi:hypothetical protein